ncbi:MAG: hypothetical protein AB7W47_15070 [Calditrichaceae bacterium]
MKKFVLTIFILMIACHSGFSQGLNQPLLVSGKVSNSAGNPIDPDNFHIKIFLKNTPQDYLTELSPSCGYTEPVWYAELGNLSNTWHYGDTLSIILEDTKLREQVRYNWKIVTDAVVPDLQTQRLSGSSVITDFNLSDRGVINGNPVYFSYRTPLTNPPSVELQIRSMDGREVFKQKEPVQVTSDSYQFIWNGKSMSGGNLRSGAYFYFINLQGQIIHSGMVSLKND